MLEGRVPESSEGMPSSGLDLRSTAIGLEALGVLTDKTVADLRATTGYVAAVLSRLAGRVIAVHPCALQAGLQARLPGVRVLGQAPHEAPTLPPADAYWLGAAMPGLPPALTARIQDGARVVTLLGPACFVGTDVRC